MKLPAKELSYTYTYADILQEDDDDRKEIINGEVFLMAPAPSSDHQEVSGEIFRQLANFLEGKRCKVYHAPFDVRLFERDGDTPKDVDTVVQPDITVVCDTSKIDKRGCKGAPDLVVEILSPSTQRHDRLVKLNLYQRAGVCEYWIVDPNNQAVQVMLLDGGSFRRCEVYTRRDIARVNVLQGCFIDLAKVFPEEEL